MATFGLDCDSNVVNTPLYRRVAFTQSLAPAFPITFVLVVELIEGPTKVDPPKPAGKPLIVTPDTIPSTLTRPGAPSPPATFPTPPPFPPAPPKASTNPLLVPIVTLEDSSII